MYIIEKMLVDVLNLFDDVIRCASFNSSAQSFARRNFSLTHRMRSAHQPIKF